MFIDAATLPSSAVLLDVDGTILDLAPTPLEVVVPPELTVALERLSKRTGGALAFVSGRPLAELDLFFQPLKLPAIAGHGAELEGKTVRAHGADHQVRPNVTRAPHAHPISGQPLERKGHPWPGSLKECPCRGLRAIDALGRG